MADTSFKVKKSLNIESGGTLSETGDVGVSSNKLRYHNGTSAADVVTASHTETLTNKTIDADSNTISNIENADIKAAAAIARTKLADGTADHVLINTGAGVMSSEAALAKVRGGTGADNSSVTFPATGTLVTRDASETLTNKTISGASNTLSNVNLASQVTGTLPIGNGGTGQTTAGPAFNALSPVTSTGDLILGNGANSATRLAIGANGTVLSSNGTTASWAAPSAIGISSVIVNTQAGYGSVGTKVFIYTTPEYSTGSDITYTSDGTDGDYMTINTTGVYSISLCVQTAGASNSGVSVNASSTSTDLSSLANSEILMMNYFVANQQQEISTSVRLVAADVIRVHGDGAALPGGAGYQRFRITRLV